MDFDSNTLLGASKALTTKEDLSAGILQALDALPADLLQKSEIVSLSTTLATNACVEEKGGAAALIFFGGDRRVIGKYGAEYGLPPTEEIYIQESFATFSGGFLREPDWDLFSSGIEHRFHGFDGVGIIEIYAMKNSAVIEKKAREIFKRKYDIPVVCGHELFDELNSLRRGASTLLNARLFPVIRAFLRAMETAAEERGITAPIFIVRSDGSLMSSGFAGARPVETLLCGPAASVLGSAYLSNHKNNVIVDMGGTTTDIALVNDGVPVKAVGGVQVGKWKTFVSGLYIKTFGLGGDSAVHYNDRDVFLEDYRVEPLCVAAEKHPRIVDNLKYLLENGRKHNKYLHEHIALVKTVADNPRYTDDERRLCVALEAGPLSLREAAESVPGKDVYTHNFSRLLAEGVVQSIGLTPTDVMHIKGDFRKYPVEASVLGARYAAMNAGMSVETLCLRVYDEVKKKLYVNIVKALLENSDDYYMKNGVGRDVERLIYESYNNAASYIKARFTTDYILTGVGAPIHIFLRDVAALLGTSAVIPEHYEVANALGAVVGSVSASSTVDIRPNYSAAGITGYTVSGAEDTIVFQTIREAEAFASAEAARIARAEAVRRGARGDIDVVCTLKTDEADTGEYRIFLGTRAVAQAVGAAGLK